MITLLPPTGPDAFNTHREGNGHYTRESTLSLSTLANTSTTTVGSLTLNKTRHASPIGVSSRRVLSNNENLSPAQYQVGIHDDKRTISLGPINRRDRPPTSGRRWSSANASRFFPTFHADSSLDHEFAGPFKHEDGEALRVYRQLLRKAPRGKTNDSVRKTSPSMLETSSELAISPPNRYSRRLKSPEHGSQQSSNAELPCDRDDRSLSDVPEQRTIHGFVAPPHCAQMSDRDPFNHRKRPSTVSSGFVHTVKTASLTNTSFSFLPKSLRLACSSEGYGRRGSDLRNSADSDRPTTTTSVDEAALERGIKRQQVVEEMIASEESYVADLKALVFLYSTLLASTSSLSNLSRSSFQQNVIELLHLHEQLLDLMHSLSFKSTHRKWFDTASRRKLGISHRIRWRGLDSRASTGPYGSHHYTKSSVEGNPLRLSAKSDGMEPVEAAEMARLFNGLMPRFDAYEEYCAKREIMMTELQQRIPAWSDFGMGIESLAKSVTSIENRATQNRKASTVADLLMKPVQRVCRYPLLLTELLKQTPVVDCPDSHADIESTLQNLHSAVKEIDLATDSPMAQAQIQRRWVLHDKLAFHDRVLRGQQFRMLGHATHCGLLHVAYQTKFQVDGSYALCILFASHFVVAIPSRSGPKFMILAVIHLSDLKLESSTDGKGTIKILLLIGLPTDGLGLQCHTALFTWKLCFEVDGQLYELILSACSSSEEEAWTKALATENAASVGDVFSRKDISSAIGIDLKPIGVVFEQAGTLTRRLSIQRAATVGNRNSVCQVIIRGTHYVQDMQDLRQSSVAINRSQSHLTTHRTTILAPKRSDRARMESSLVGIWTRDTLPAPNMNASRGGQIIRASAGSLVRKLSLASIHGPFGRRSASLTLTSKRSGEAFGGFNRESHSTPIYEVKKDSQELEGNVRLETGLEPRYMNEAQLEREEPSQLGRVLSVASRRTSLTGSEHLLRRGTKNKRRASRAGAAPLPEDSAKKFYSFSEKISNIGVQDEVDAIVEEKLRSRKRWSNPIGFLGEGIRHIIFSSSHK